MKHLDSNNILTDHQHVFRKGRSCETQLVNVIDDWSKCLDKGVQVDTFVLDFEKAFDTVPHELLKIPDDGDACPTQGHAKLPLGLSGDCCERTVAWAGRQVPTFVLQQRPEPDG